MDYESRPKCAHSMPTFSCSGYRRITCSECGRLVCAGCDSLDPTPHEPTKFMVCSACDGTGLVPLSKEESHGTAEDKEAA